MNSPLTIGVPRVEPLLSSLPTSKEQGALDYRRVLANAIEPIQDDLIEVERLIAIGLRVEDAKVQSMLNHVRELGGKRLRPCLTLLSAKACGGITQETIRLAASVELVHTATLIHDDILDKAETRRHHPTLHRRFDTSSSVLVGDWLFTHAYDLANQGESTTPGRWIAQAAKEVCEGEIKQGAATGNFRLSIRESLGILSGKTGALCRVACALGAWSGGADKLTCERFGKYGEFLGISFQIYDDWLDVWGDETRAGKTLGTDLALLKPTIPSLRALHEGFVASERELLIESLAKRDEAAIHKLRGAMIKGYGSSFTLQLAQDFSEKATLLLGFKGWDFTRESILDRLSLLARAACHRTA